MGSNDPPVVWGKLERQALDRARRLLGHSQKELMRELIKLGAPEVTQPTLSQWISGGIKRPPPAALVAIARYCQLAQGQGEGRQAVEEANEPRQLEPMGSTFDALISPITGERMLSDRQARLVDAVIRRLDASDGPMSQEDGHALRWASRVIGLGDPRPHKCIEEPEDLSS